jgi:rhamnulokinase
MLADVGRGRVELHEVHRFANRPVTVAGTLHWDLLSLWGGVIDGLRTAVRQDGRIAGVAVDSWAIDYALLDPDGRCWATRCTTGTSAPTASRRR